MMRSARWSTPDAADCDDQELTGCLRDVEGHPGRRRGMGRGLSCSCAAGACRAAGKPQGPADRSPSRAHGGARPCRSPQRRLPALAAHRARDDRAARAAHPHLQRAQGRPRLRPARQGRRSHDPRLLPARALDPQGGDRAAADPRPAGQPGDQRRDQPTWPTPASRSSTCRGWRSTAPVRAPSAASTSPTPATFG